MLTTGIRAVIPGGVTVEDFAQVCKTDKNSAESILQTLFQNKIGTIENDVINFEDGDKLRTAIFALRNGAQIEEVSKSLDWRDFEKLVENIFQLKEFATLRNLILTKPRMEIDVIGIKHGIAILIDCKHWSKQSPSSLQNAVEKQIERVKHYVKKTQGAIAIPGIVTLYQEQIQFINKVPIIPISKFSSFLDEFLGNIEKMKTIKNENEFSN